MVAAEIINQQPLCFGWEEQMTSLRRSRWPCSTVTLLGDTILFLQPGSMTWKIFLIPPAFLLWKTDHQGCSAPASLTWCHRETITQSPQAPGRANTTVTLHAKTFSMLPIQQWQETGMKSHRPGISVLTTARLPPWSSCTTAAEPQSPTCSLSLTP